jgi:hypothetical protein
MIDEKHDDIKINEVRFMEDSIVIGYEDSELKNPRPYFVFYVGINSAIVYPLTTKYNKYKHSRDRFLFKNTFLNKKSYINIRKP